MTGETEPSGESQTVANVVVDTTTTIPTTTTVVEDAAPATPDPRVPKMGKPVIVRRNGKPDAPALIAEVTPKMLITAVVLAANHHLVETVKNLREIHPSEKLTGWYWPEEWA